MTISEFKKRSVDKHGDKYDYSFINNIDSKTPVTIICGKHGTFSQNIYKHLNGQGCPKCIYDSKRMSKEDFIKKADTIHRKKYDYNDVDYKNNSTNIDIICPTHGLFQQTPLHHLQGAGCQECGGSKKIILSDFIKKSNKVHNNKYNYNDVIYKGNKEKVCIKCDKHGYFYQLPINHLRGSGCPSCSNLKKLTNDDFIKKSNLVHNNKYNYDNVNYLNHKSIVSIKCDKHGEFKQVAGQHLSGSGCPICKSSKGEIKIETFLKKYNINYKSQYTFSDLKHKGLLKFDFGLLNDYGKLICVVEFNGEQHYKFKINFHKTIDGFEIYKYRDGLKFDYCEINKIPLIIIKYNEDIDDVMMSILKKFFLK